MRTSEPGGLWSGAARRAGAARARRVWLAAAVVAWLPACSAPEPTTRAVSAPGPRFYRELAIDEAGGDTPALHVDRDGRTLWAAVAGASSKTGRSRLYRRDGTRWTKVREGPFASELSLSSYRAGEVFLGFNQPLDGFRPRLVRVRVSDDGATTMEDVPAPAEEIAPGEWLQVGGYAITGDQTGFACGQRGRLWRLAGGRWETLPQVLPWSPGDPANASYCASIALTGAREGFLVDFAGKGAAWDGERWTALEQAGSRDVGLVAPASGLTFRAAHVGRFVVGPGGATARVLGGELLPGMRGSTQAELANGAPTFDEAGTLMANAAGVLAIDRDGVRVVARELHFQPRALARLGDDVVALASDGIYRLAKEGTPTFAPAPPGAIPPGLAYAQALDLDQDGDEDLLGLSPRGDEARGRAGLFAYLNDGTGRFSARALGIPETFDLWRDRFDAGDVDGDGDVDLVTTSDNRVELWRRMSGGYVRAWSTEAPGATVRLVDVDGDGDLDLATVPAKPGLYLNDGVGGFTPAPPLPYPEPFRTERAAWGDLDGDGDADAVLQHWRDGAHLLRNDGARFTLVRTELVAEGAELADLDRDGVAEVLGQTVHQRERALPFSRCVLDRPRFACARIERTGVPGGRLVDVNLDGTLDVIRTDLRGDEAMTGEGEVWLGSPDGFPSTPRPPAADPEGFRDVTRTTGALPQPTQIDADGDGDPDVYATPLGLRVNTTDRGTFVRVRPRASRSDRLARGAWVLVRTSGSETVVATARADFGVATVGVPDGRARYDVEVRFPTGERVVRAGLPAGTDVEIRDAAPARFALRLARLWIVSTTKLTRARTHAAPLALAIVAAALLARRLRGWGASSLRSGASTALLGLPLLGIGVRAGGGLEALVAPGALAGAALLEATITAVLRARAARRAGPYLLEEKLGAGAAATVWRARAGRSSVALKLFDAQSMGVAESRERFFREARVGGEIAHPNVVRIKDSGQLDDGRCYLAMELVPGRSLARELATASPLPPRRAAEIAREIARGLGALHEAGIVHRDVKPENVMLKTDGTAVLTDLGLARSALFRTMTRQDVAVGTLAYMSPEQCVGRKLDGRSDLWSLGVTLYEMLTGRRPFDAEHELELVYVIHNVDPEAPSSGAGVPEELSTITMRCLARDPDDRFRTARDVEDALTAFLAG